MSLTIQRVQHPGGVVELRIRPRHEPDAPFDVEPADAVTVERAAGAELAAGHTRLLFDLEQVQHVYSAALWAIVAAGAAAHTAGGQAVVVSRSPYLARALAVTSGGTVVELRADRASGLTACAA